MHRSYKLIFLKMITKIGTQYHTQYIIIVKPIYQTGFESETDKYHQQ